MHHKTKRMLALVGVIMFLTTTSVTGHMEMDSIDELELVMDAEEDHRAETMESIKATINGICT